MGCVPYMVFHCGVVWNSRNWDTLLRIRFVPVAFSLTREVLGKKYSWNHRPYNLIIPWTASLRRSTTLEPLT